MRLLSYSLAIILFVNELSAMDDGFIPHYPWSKSLILSSENYLQILPNQYACLCTKFGHIIFQTDTRTEELRKQKHLKRLIRHLKKGDWNEKKVFNFITKTMLPYTDDYGKKFAKGAINLLQLANKQDLSDIPLKAPDECKICFSSKVNQIFSPCGHAMSCEKCSKRLDDCPMCRKNYRETIAFSDLIIAQNCTSCEEASAALLSKSCNHLLLCENCYEEKVFCPCGALLGREKIKIYFN